MFPVCAHLIETEGTKALKRTEIKGVPAQRSPLMQEQGDTLVSIFTCGINTDSPHSTTAYSS